VEDLAVILRVFTTITARLRRVVIAAATPSLFFCCISFRHPQVPNK
jgi:hypothetical protein